MLSHSHVSSHQSVHAVDWPSVSAEQDDDLHNDDQSRKSPAQQEVEQVATLCVLVIHHQHLPEVHRLWMEEQINTYSIPPPPQHTHTKRVAPFKCENVKK